MEYFFAGVIHDIKNQLTELALRLDRRGDAKQEKALIMKAAARLTELLLFARQSSGQLSANVDSSIPEDLLQEMAAEYRELFPGLELKLDTLDAPPFWFYDTALTHLALANAIHNACSHARSTVHLSARSNDGWLVFEIRDDGPGYPASLLQSGADDLAPVSQRGTGLGLFLARRIAALHTLENRCGDIELANDNGAVFRIRLP
ncbi:MAG: HAMP domain-containing sensor histidine kinase [Pseudomonadota bacterium]